jgi:hypothetical protein
LEWSLKVYKSMKTIIKTIIKLLSKSRKRYCKTLKRKQKDQERIAWSWIAWSWIAWSWIIKLENK